VKNNNSLTFVDTKPHYALLDGLRGVAALLVVWYHIFEGYAFAGGIIVEVVNHGYLAVDFFFILSGFVISYAYDDRIGKKFTFNGLLKHRLIRLHPMVIMGALIGTVAYCIQGRMQWNGTQVPFHIIIGSLLLGLFFIPILPKSIYDVRGNGEMFPLNGPCWSLFFEYIANIVYAVLIHRFSNKVLTIWTILLGIGLAYFAIYDVVGYGCIGVGWTFDVVNLVGGLLRTLFSFSLGMLMARNFKAIKVRGAFWTCSIILVVLFHVPYIADSDGINYNGLFEMLCIAIVFPILIWLGASGRTTDNMSTKVCKFLGDISFPVYIVHYPLMYLFYSWLIVNKLYTLYETWQIVLIVMIGSIILAFLCLRFYDEPLRKWLLEKNKPEKFLLKRE
jgi:peptidoglycan/LPS O-acetylase OafA/YrhL